MEIIIHRVNNIKLLEKVPRKMGCEIDIRTDGSKLVLSHDPFKKGDDFLNFIDQYDHGTLVLNIKESGIENIVLSELQKRNIKNYFLLDVEFPFMYKASINKIKNIAVRFSAFEPIEQVEIFKDKLEWVWIDTMETFPISDMNYKILNNFKLCLVCPSLWGRKDDIKSIKKLLSKYEIHSVMTDFNNLNYWIN